MLEFSLYPEVQVAVVQRRAHNVRQFLVIPQDALRGVVCARGVRGVVCAGVIVSTLCGKREKLYFGELGLLDIILRIGF